MILLLKHENQIYDAASGYRFNPRQWIWSNGILIKIQEIRNWFNHMCLESIETWFLLYLHSLSYYLERTRNVWYEYQH